MANTSVRKRWLAGGLAAGACALGAAAWVYADQHAATAPPPTAAAVARPATPASPASAEKLPWHKLTRAQQTALQPLAGEWNRLDAPRKQKWLDIANRYASMKPGEQARVQERMRDWVKLTPEQRRQVRENYARTKKIDPGQKSAQWQQYQQLSDEQKQQLAIEASAKKPLNRVPAVDSTTRKAPLSMPALPAPPAAAAPQPAPAAMGPAAAPSPLSAPAPAAAPAAPNATNNPNVPNLAPPASTNAN